SYVHVNRIITIYALGGISSRPGSDELIIAERLKYLDTEYAFISDEHKKLTDLQQKIDLLGKSSLIKLVRKIHPSWLKHIIPG
ncbi:MAG: hypothetical protein ABI390_09780, partial [Daejeonella sp.]